MPKFYVVKGQIRVKIYGWDKGERTAFGRQLRDCNIGTGTTSVNAKLEVNGNARYNQTAYFDAEYDNGSKTGAFTVDWSNGNKQKVTITGASLGITFTAPPGPCNVILKIVQGDGSDTLSWTTVPKWPSGTSPTLTTASSATDIISLYYDGTNYYGMASLNFQ